MVKLLDGTTISNPVFFRQLIQNTKFLGIVTQTNDVCRRAMLINPYSLKYVKNQTEEICLEAVRQNGLVLQYVQNQTEQICLEAIKQDRLALKYVDESILERIKNKL